MKNRKGKRAKGGGLLPAAFQKKKNERGRMFFGIKTGGQNGGGDKHNDKVGGSINPLMTSRKTA